MILVAAKGAISALRSRCRTVHQLQVIRLCTRRTHTNGLPKQLRVVVSKQRSSSLYSTNVTRSWPTQLQAIRPLQAEANSHPSELFRAADSNDLQKASTKPRIMLIGWLGAQKIHLDKYAQLWQSSGYKTTTVQPPTAGIVLPSIGDAAAAAYVDQLDKILAVDQRMVFHIFSNAGFLFFGSALRLLADRKRVGNSRTQGGSAPQLSKLSSNVDGIILDSAPAFITPDIAARGLASALLRMPADTVTHKHPISVAVARAVTTPYLQLPAIAGRQHELWERWQDSAPLSPQLYLFSEADALIPADQIAAFASMQADRGVDVHQHDFGDSPHVEHMRRHPAEYSAALQDFMRVLSARGRTGAAPTDVQSV